MVTNSLHFIKQSGSMLEMLSTEPKVVRIVERAAQRVLRGSRVLFKKEQMLDDDDELASRSSFCKKMPKNTP